jgi:hypothetical protein
MPGREQRTREGLGCMTGGSCGQVNTQSENKTRHAGNATIAVVIFLAAVIRWTTPPARQYIAEPTRCPA